jgi:hypothetical protein
VSSADRRVHRRPSHTKTVRMSVDPELNFAGFDESEIEARGSSRRFIVYICLVQLLSRSSWLSPDCIKRQRSAGATPEPPQPDDSSRRCLDQRSAISVAS